MCTLTGGDDRCWQQILARRSRGARTSIPFPSASAHNSTHGKGFNLKPWEAARAFRVTDRRRRERCLKGCLVAVIGRNS